MTEACGAKGVFFFFWGGWFRGVWEGKMEGEFFFWRFLGLSDFVGGWVGCSWVLLSFWLAFP